MTKRDAMRAAVEALECIKARVVGDALPRWDHGGRTTHSRCLIADDCDAALSLLRSALEEGEETACLECGDGFVAHDPGICGTCYATKYASPTADKDAK